MNCLEVRMTTKQYLKIGLDFHGVINRHPSYFKDFTAAATSRGHEIYIITGGPAQKIACFLKGWGICYHELFAIMDYYAAKGEIQLFPDGSFHIDDKLWNTAKAKFCQKYHIDIHIDDSDIYGKSFSTPYCRYDEVSCSCLLDNHYRINLSLPPEEAVTQLERILLRSSS